MDEQTERVIEASARLNSLHLVAQIVLAQVFLHNKPEFLRAYAVALRKTRYDAVASPTAELGFEIQAATLEATKTIFRQVAGILGVEKELLEVESNQARS